MKPETIKEELNKLDGWILIHGRVIEKSFKTDSYQATIKLVNAIADIAEAENHHPEMEVGYTDLKVVYTTHDAEGLTEKDFACAAQLDAL